MGERKWVLRFPWLIPLATVPWLPWMAMDGPRWTVTAALCLAAALLAIADVQNGSEREGLRFAYDDLREKNIALQETLRQTPTPDHEAEAFADLTERELAVVRLVAEGMDNREIAASLFLSEGTVRNHISSVLAKKQLTNRTQIAVAYYRGS